LEEIGEGGFGVIFLAEQIQPVRRKVALKILKAGMDSKQVVARFEAERQALALMDHPNIARVFDGGSTPSGRPYFVMELVRGVPITDFCDQNQLAPRERLGLFLQVCAAVQHAHQKGVIHRDLKPSNVLVSRHDATPVVKVIDFGVAKALGQELTDKTLFTGLGQMVGTPLYMSPEQAGMSDLDVDTRSDVYSLGVLLYELLTGTTPFTKERFKTAGYDEIRRIIREEDPPKPSTRLSESKASLSSISAQRHTEPANLAKLVRGELDWVVMKALEKDRSRRYESPSALAADVERYLRDEPVTAGAPSGCYRFRKFARRNRGPVLAGTLVLLALVGGVIGTTAGMLGEKAARLAEADQRREAEDARRLADKTAAAEALARGKAEYRLAEQSLQRGLSHCDRGEVTVGLLWLARGLREAPADAADLHRILRLNLAAWGARTQPVRAPLLPHRGQIRAAAFSPSGRSVLAGSLDRTAQLWEVATGKPLLISPLKHQYWVNAVAVSPDGNTLLTCSEDGTAQLWDAVTGTRLAPPLRHEGPIQVVTFSPDGTVVLTGSGDNTARLWDAKTGRPHGVPMEHDGTVLVAAFSPDGKSVERITLWAEVTTGLSLDEDGVILRLDYRDWHDRSQRLRELGGPPAAVR
jgi:hypothetical protein